MKLGAEGPERNPWTIIALKEVKKRVDNVLENAGDSDSQNETIRVGVMQLLVERVGMDNYIFPFLWCERTKGSSFDSVPL